MYVFDEPSSNLDMKSVEVLRNLMLSLKNEGKTIIVSEHRIYYLKDIVDRFYYLEDGEIIDSFTGDELNSFADEFFIDKGLRFYSLDKVITNTQKLNEVNSLDLDKISFSYNKKQVFKNLSYSFKSGNIYGIIGDNGAGKSTLFKLLSGLLKEKSGKISINGNVLNKRKRLKKIFYLSNNADSNLFEASLEDELKLNDPEADVDKILKDFKLESVKDLHPQILSGGQKQRLTIAVSELLERNVYLFDEPTSGLDGNNMRIISRKLKELQEKQKLILLISHDYEFLMNTCNIILHLDQNNFKEFNSEKDKDKILKILLK
ncbi:ATP-binding cassette domain-containing protein [Peptoniphilus ovalis]|uniref:ATP-binding cassette domain-containing protein n=1 Tax=Peptoniphilus ovalis TaxID=2841503 RepID=UPI0031BACFCB